MNTEDEILADLQDLKRAIEQKDLALEKKDKIIAQLQQRLNDDR